MNTKAKAHEFDIQYDEDDIFDEKLSEKDKHKEQIINGLIDEYKENRESLKFLIKDLEELKEKVDKIFPQNLDARYMRFFEDKIKAATQLFGAILEIRKEIGKCLKTEIDLRKSVTSDNEEFGEISQEEVRALSKQIESFKKDKEKTEKKIRKIEEKHINVQ